jgi:UDPglucose 6-dehydrogenase
MKIGIVGLGVVGKALKSGFERLGHEVLVHDRKLDTKITDLFECSVIYVCVPTPSRPDGACDTSIVDGVLGDLRGYEGDVAIKSTIPPGTTCLLWSKHCSGPRRSYSLSHVPEFLRAACPEVDFVERQRCLVIGTWDMNAAQCITDSHGHYPQAVIRVSPYEAEVIKYMYNAFNALRIVFADEFWQVCQKSDADYNVVKNTFVRLENIPNSYLDITEKFRGVFGGECLPKDCKAILSYAREHGISMKLLEAVQAANGTN